MTELANPILHDLVGGRYIVRTQVSGVSIGVITAVEATVAGLVVSLTDAVRVWKWEGAFTLADVARNGNAVCRFDRHPDGVVIAESGMELLPVSDDIWERLSTSGSYG